MLYCVCLGYRKLANDVHGYDIALLKTNVPIRFNRYTQPALMDVPPNPTLGTALYTAGWGTTQTGAASDWLKFVRYDKEIFLTSFSTNDIALSNHIA